MFRLKDFKTGDRVQLHPATDWWAKGARYGVVIMIGRVHLTIQLDLLPKPVAVKPEDVVEIVT